MTSRTLLIVTQYHNPQDPVMGFFGRWIEEFRKQGPTHIICTKRGLWAFWTSLWHRRLFEREGWFGGFGYDVVLVHMCPIWVILGWPFWRKKRVYLWYEAQGGGWKLWLATKLVRKVFSASTHGTQTPKTMVTGHGIDTELFRAPRRRGKGAGFITVGRDAPSKRIETLVACTKELQSSLRIICCDPQWQVIKSLQGCTMFLHASETALDKALLEAMSCGCLVLSCGKAKAILPAICQATPETMADQARKLLALPEEEKQRLREHLRAIVLNDHALPILMRRLWTEMFPRLT